MEVEEEEEEEGQDDAKEEQVLPYSVGLKEVGGLVQSLRQGSHVDEAQARRWEMEWEDVVDDDNDESLSPSAQRQRLVVVVDTNFLLSHLRWLLELKVAAVRAHSYILVPWTVLGELDGLKHSERPLEGTTVGALARRATRLLRMCLSHGDPGVRGQRVLETLTSRANKSVRLDVSNDDRILDAALFHVGRPNTLVVMLSNDHNLCLKSVVNRVPAFSWSDMSRGVPTDGVWTPELYDAALVHMARAAFNVAPPPPAVASVPAAAAATPQQQPTATTAATPVLPPAVTVETKAATPAAVYEEGAALLVKNMPAAIKFHFVDVYGEEDWLDIVCDSPPWHGVRALLNVVRHHLQGLFADVDGVDGSKRARKVMDRADKVVKRAVEQGASKLTVDDAFVFISMFEIMYGLCTPETGADPPRATALALAGAWKDKLLKK